MVRMVSFGYISSKALGVLNKYCIYGTGKCIINYMCVCSSAQGALLIKTPSLCSNKLHLPPFLRKRPLNALCRI